MSDLKELSQSIIESVKDKNIFNGENATESLEAFKSFVTGNEYGVNPDQFPTTKVVSL